MGQYLEKLITKKETSSGAQGGIEYAMSSMQGWREEMEDSHICDPNFDTDTQLYAIFDGHCGHEAAKFAERHFANQLKANEAYKNKDFPTALKQTFLRIDEILQTEEETQELSQIFKKSCDYKLSDFTANVTLIHKSTIYIANAGDSKCVLSCEGKSEDLSKDQDPIDLVKLKRIKKDGGLVSGRGDIRNKEFLPEEQLINALTDIVVREITPKDEFLLIGCDGIWKIKNNQELITICRNELVNNTPLTKVVQNLMNQLIVKDTKGDCSGSDNMSMILVKLQKQIFHNNSDNDDGNNSKSDKRKKIIDRLGPIYDDYDKNQNIKLFQPWIKQSYLSTFFGNKYGVINQNIFSPFLKIKETHQLLSLSSSKSNKLSN